VVNDVGNIISGAQRAQLLSLQKTTRQLDVTSLRLATGQKVHSALDNPANFFLARSLRNRAADLDKLLDGIGQNIRMIEEADHGVKADLEILDLAEAYLKDIEKKYMAGEVPTTLGPAPNETWVLFNSAGQFTTYVSGQDAGGAATITGNDTVTFAGGSPWKRLAFNYTVTAQTNLVFDYSSSFQPEVSSIGFDNDQNFGNDNDRFFIYGTQTGGVTTAVPFPTYLYTGAGAVTHYDIPVGTYFAGNFTHLAFINDDDAAPFGNATFSKIILREGAIQPGTQISDGSSFEEEYAKIVDQLDLIAKDAQYRGVNLLKKDDMMSVFNEDRTSTLVTKGMDATRAGLGLSIEDFDSLEAVQAKIGEVRAARNKLRVYGSTLAANLNILQVRDVFTRETINVHKKGASDLTDADLNEEGATMLALQTMQQLQTMMLAMRPANVLNILG
jgi:flagellin